MTETSALSPFNRSSEEEATALQAISAALTSRTDNRAVKRSLSTAFEEGCEPAQTAAKRTRTATDQTAASDSADGSSNSASAAVPATTPADSSLHPVDLSRAHGCLLCAADIDGDSTMRDSIGFHTEQLHAPAAASNSNYPGELRASRLIRLIVACHCVAPLSKALRPLSSRLPLRRPSLSTPLVRAALSLASVTSLFRSRLSRRNRHECAQITVCTERSGHGWWCALLSSRCEIRLPLLRRCCSR